MDILYIGKLEDCQENRNLNANKPLGETSRVMFESSSSFKVGNNSVTRLNSPHFLYRGTTLYVLRPHPLSVSSPVSVAVNLILSSLLLGNLESRSKLAFTLVIVLQSWTNDEWTA